MLDNMGERSPLSKDDRARLAAAVEAARGARAEMRSGKILVVPRKRELRRAIREGDEAAEALAKAGDSDGLAD
jgi:hypothetical protein